MKTYIIGHINPDLDSVAAAIAASELFTKTECFSYLNSEPVIASPVNAETAYVLNRFSQETPTELDQLEIHTDDLFILVDHNEKSQRHAAIGDSQIVEIIDHHKLNINFDQPIYVNTKTWGATCTILWWLMHNNNFQPSPNLAGLMLGAILSDTLGLKSPLTTNKDREAADSLAQTAQITEIDQFIRDVFNAKSNLIGLTPTEIVTKDYKIFDFNNKKVLINQVETIETEKLLNQTDTLIDAMKQAKTAEQVDYIFCVVSDILKLKSQIICTTDEEATIIESAFTPKKISALVYDIGNRVSRKKEIAPPIEQVINQQNTHGNWRNNTNYQSA